MNLADYNIDVENEAQPEFKPLPVGDYTCIITNSELKDTQAGNGKLLAVTFEVVDGEYAGRALWTNLNIQNPSDVAEKIGRSQLASICKAVGVMNPQDSEELHATPLVVKVGLDKKDPSRNACKAFRAIDDTTPVAAPAPVKEAPKPTASKKPWQK